MEGVLLFSDDHIYDSERAESSLCESFGRETPTLGVHNLELATNAVKSIGSFKALILDWQYGSNEDFQDIEEELGQKIVLGGSVKEDAALKFLLENDFYTLIYIFSTEDVETKHGEILKKKFGDRVKFKIKDQDFNKENAEKIKDKILEEIREWEKDEKGLAVPIIWSQTINQAMQSMFKELHNADPHWISELYQTATCEPVVPSVEVINLFQDLLSEYVIQNANLNNKITDAAQTSPDLNPEKYSEIVRLFYYGKVLKTAPIMTGDIIRFEEDKFGIIITPECDIRHIVEDPANQFFEILEFKQQSYSKSQFSLKAKIKALPLISKAEEVSEKKFTENQKVEISQALNIQIKEAVRNLQIEAFTQTNPRLHLLPCFPFKENDFSGIINIDFRTSLKLVLGSEVTPEKRLAKLNSPFILELRQRYLSYKGRVGVSGHSRKLREWLLDKN